MNSFRIFALFIMCISLSGCWLSNAYLWHSYKPPTEGSFRAPNTPVSCPRIGVQNLSDEQADTIIEVVKEVCELQTTQKFRDAILKKQDWLASCDRTKSKPDTIISSEVLKIVSGPKADFSVIARKPIGAIAQIDPAKARVAIRKQRFEHWIKGTNEQRSEMIATLAHEMTHFVKPDGAISYRFKDRGHGSKSCPDDRLVSYEVGNITQCLWLAARQKVQNSLPQCQETYKILGIASSVNSIL